MKAFREWHGMKRDPAYQPWLSMVQRCTNPNEKNYAIYAGKLCAEWRESFLAFYREIGPRPSMAHTIDRIDNDRGYEPGNVRWATRVEQNKNRKQTIRITHNGLTLCLKDWARHFGINYGTLRAHIRIKGTPFVEAISKLKKGKTK